MGGKIVLPVKSQDDNGIVEVRNNFNARLRKINGSGKMEVGEVYNDLIKLRNNILKRFDSAEGRELAFQVQCTARSLLPCDHDLWEKLPPDVLRLIFSKANKSENTANCITMNQLLISKQITSSLLSLRNNWINSDFISPKMFGCVNSKQAIEFIIKQELNVANLLEFPDFGDDDLETLSRCRPQLNKLSIGANKLTGIGLEEALGRFKTLRQLEILDRRFCSHALSAIKKLPLLESISLCGNWWQDSNFENAIENLPWLQNLKLQAGNSGYSENMMDKSLETLKKLTKLKSLEFTGHLAFSEDTLVEVIEKNPLLQSLTFSEDAFGKMGDKFVDAIGRLSLLHSLNLSGGRKLPIKIAESIGKLTLLQSLNLSGCYQLGDKLPEILEKLTLLQSLDISHCSRLHVAGLSEAIEKNTLLTSLKLGGCCNDTDRLLKMLEKLPLLKSLGIYNASVSDEDLVKIMEMLPLLEILDISACFAITGDKLVLMDKLPKLQSLNLQEVEISGDNLVKLVGKIPTLKHLNLSRCKQISDDHFLEIVKSLPKLESLMVPATANEEGSWVQFPFHHIEGDQEAILEKVKELIAKKAITQ